MCYNVIIRTDGKAGHISLNRSSALHALTQEMCDAITRALRAWKDDDAVELVIVDHAPGTRGFCAGGDVSMLASSGRCDAKQAHQFFQTEYQLNQFIASYPKPYVAIMDGVTMGGGVGLSIHGSYQIATERTVLSMPETGIGLFPDIGATWFLPRLRGQLGTWLALTGARLKGQDVVAAGLATHYYKSNRLAGLKQDLAEKGLSALSDQKSAYSFSLAEHLAEIEYAFGGADAAEILGRLKSGSAWAKSQATKLRAKSPLSTKIALRQMRTGPFLNCLRDALRIEYRIAYRLVHCREFHEGVRAVLIEKDHLPYWQPSHLKAVSFDMVSQFFAPLGDNELQFVEP
ncbi:MAG: enoyl-CoA hydratase/isomerase family protein [Henriciella sp.]